MYAALLFSLSVHEASHAAMADRCGDPSARILGRVSLNPLVHIDLMGTVVMPIIMLMMPGMLLFGWAKPVPFNSDNLRNARRDPVLIAVAGPLSNLVLLFVSILVMRILVTIFPPELGSQYQTLLMFPYFLIFINLVLFLFNLIPVPPLDGHYVLNYFLPPKGQKILNSIGPFGILIAILVASRFLGGPLSYLLTLVDRVVGLS
jgi:Zn-dependent protease